MADTSGFTGSFLKAMQSGALVMPPTVPATALTYQHLLAGMQQVSAAAARYGNQGLRGRIVADPLDEFMAKAKSAMKAIIQDDTPHQSVAIRSGWERATDRYKVTVFCRSCERTWQAQMDGAKLLVDIDPDQWEREFIHEMLAPLIDRVEEDDCFGVRERAMLAEWATSRLAAAGKRGMPYVQLVHEAVEARLVTPKDIDSVLRSMKFVQEWVTLANSGIILPGGWDGEWTLPILHLPVGHPLRDW